MNQNGFTFLTAIFMVMIIGVMLGLTGKSWTMIMKREREKELIFRGSQIKEAIENWYNPNYSVNGVRWPANKPLTDLKDLLQNPNTLTPMRYLPQSYGAELDDKNRKCGSECAKLKVYQDPMTGKEWTLIRGNYGPDGAKPNAGGGIVGVASKSSDAPLKTDFKDTALENMAGNGAMFATPVVAGTNAPAASPGTAPGGLITPPATAGKMEKYSEWRFIAEPPGKNDHAKIYRAYHERW